MLRSPAAGLASKSALCALALALALGAAAQAAELGLVVSQPWLRLIMRSCPAAGYFVLSNQTAQMRTLVGAASPACGALMLHRSFNDNGQSAGREFDFAVGGHGDAVDHLHPLLTT